MTEKEKIGKEFSEGGYKVEEDRSTSERDTKENKKCI